MQVTVAAGSTLVGIFWGPAVDTEENGPSLPRHYLRHHENAQPRRDVCCRVLLQSLAGLAAGDKIAMHLKEAEVLLNHCRAKTMKISSEACAILPICLRLHRTPALYLYLHQYPLPLDEALQRPPTFTANSVAHCYHYATNCPYECDMKIFA